MASKSHSEIHYLVYESWKLSNKNACVCGCRCQWTRRFDRVLEDAAAEWYPHIKFVRVSGELVRLFFISDSLLFSVNQVIIVF